MRRYTFTNWMLNSVQQGIQAGHAGDELFVKYRNSIEQDSKNLWTWAKYHKTYILLNGGDYKSIKEIALYFQREACTFSWAAPWASFNEDAQSLGGLLTSVAIIVPEYIYEAKMNKETGNYEYTVDDEQPRITTPADQDFNFINLLKSCSLAR